MLTRNAPVGKLPSMARNEKFHAFWFGLDKSERQSFADRCASSPHYLTQLAYGYKNCGPDLAVNIERETNHELLADEMCPGTDWPVIRGHQVETA